MVEVRPTRRPVEITDPPDPVELVARGTGVEPYPVRARLRLGVGREEAARSCPAPWGCWPPTAPSLAAANDDEVGPPA